MVISTIPAKELIEILKNDGDGVHREFGVYCFFLVREITNKELLRSLLSEFTSFDSLTGDRVLIVLFYTNAENIGRVKEVEREFDKRRIYAHRCRWIRAQLASSAINYDELFSATQENRQELQETKHQLALFYKESAEINYEDYLASMTNQTDELKAALGISEKDIPCILFIDRDFDDMGVLRLKSEDDISRAYDAIKQIIYRYCERHFEVFELKLRKEEIKKRLKKLVPLSEAHPNDRQLKKKIDEFSGELNEIDKALKDKTSGPSLTSIIDTLNRNQSIKDFTTRVMPFRDLIPKILGIIVG